LKVIVDTNGLMVQAQFGVDIFDELARLGYDECLVPSAVIDELKMLEDKLRGKDKIALTVAVCLSKRCRSVEAPGKADDVILGLAKELNAPVFTNDGQLRKRLRDEGIRTIFLRSKHKLDID
jgi:hypothetical protein